MDEFGIYLNNTKNELVKSNGAKIPVVRKWVTRGFFWITLQRRFTNLL